MQQNNVELIYLQREATKINNGADPYKQFVHELIKICNEHKDNPYGLHASLQATFFQLFTEKLYTQNVIGNILFNIPIVTKDIYRVFYETKALLPIEQWNHPLLESIARCIKTPEELKAEEQAQEEDHTTPSPAPPIEIPIPDQTTPAPEDDLQAERKLQRLFHSFKEIYQQKLGYNQNTSWKSVAFWKNLFLRLFNRSYWRESSLRNRFSAEPHFKYSNDHDDITKTFNHIIAHAQGIHQQQGFNGKSTLTVLREMKVLNKNNHVTQEMNALGLHDVDHCCHKGKL